jgi:exopolysaccharide biosynthesis polyprenyl glycosylphosphotransferase
MIRLLHAYFPTRTLFLGISEACLVSLAFLAATVARLGRGATAYLFDYQHGSFKILVASLAIVTCMYYFDLYGSSILRSRREIVIRLTQVLGTVYSLSVLLYYLYPPLELGRGIFVIGLLFAATILLLWRELFLMINRVPEFSARTLILGDGPMSESLIRELGIRPELGMRVVGQLKTLTNGHDNSALSSAAEQTETFLTSVKFYEPDHIVVALGERRGCLPTEALLHLKSRGVYIHDSAELYEAITGKIPPEALRLSWLLFSPGFRISRRLVVFKRAISFVLSFLGVVITLPLMGLIALAIFLDSGGPVIFKQERVGLHGRIFTLYKFRTMVVGTNDGCNPQPTEIADTRFTRIGRALRRTRLDELPQLINILLGDMGFIGPRPFVPNQERECVENIPHYRHRWTIRPGVTGWAQVNRGYNVTIEDNKEKLAYDLYYIKNQSIGLDLLVLLKTMKVALLGLGSR